MKLTFAIKNFFIFALAPILALGLFFLTRDLSELTASVLDISELQKIEDNKRWVAYKTDNQLFELFGSDQAKKGENLVFELIYNPQKISLLIEQNSGLNFTILENTTGNFKVQLHSLGILKIDENWFQIPFSGEKNQLILAEASLLTRGKTSIPLSIGNLNPEEEHSFLP